MHGEHADIDGRLRALLAERLQLDPGVTVDDGASLLDLGLDSAALLSVVIGIEETFDIDVPDQRDHDRQLRQSRVDEQLHRRAARIVSERPSTVAAMLAATVERFGDRLAVVDGPHRRTWAELDADVRRRAAALSGRGIGRATASPSSSVTATSSSRRSSPRSDSARWRSRSIRSSPTPSSAGTSPAAVRPAATWRGS